MLSNKVSVQICGTLCIFAILDAEFEVTMIALKCLILEEGYQRKVNIELTYYV